MVFERFVSTAPIGQIAIDILNTRAPVEISPSTSQESVISLMDGTLGLICRAETQINESILDAGKDLIQWKIIQNLTPLTVFFLFHQIGHLKK